MTIREWTLADGLKFVVSIVFLTASLLMSAHAQDEGAVCWKPTYARGAGTIPGECGPGEHREAGLCYKVCPAGFVGLGTACHQACPEGFKSAGLLDKTCTKPDAFVRTGFPTTGNGPAQCNAQSQGRGCEQVSGTLFVKPPAGFECAGPQCGYTCPDGMTPTDNGRACRKRDSIARGAGSIPNCGSDASPQGGLCYKNCTAGFGGAGPVCWGRCPASHPIDCGGMCGKHSSQCAAAVANQAISVLDFAATTIETVVTLGAAAGIRTAVNAAEKAAQEAAEAAITAAAKATAKAAKKDLKDVVTEYAKDTGVSMSIAQADNLANMVNGDKFDFTSLDPTGISAMVAAFKKPVCELPPNANQPVKANPRLAGQVVKNAPGEPFGVYIVSPAGNKHRIWDQMLANRNEPYTTLLRTCGLVGPGDILPSNEWRIWPAKEIGGAGLQEWTVAAAVPRGKPLDNSECREMAAALKAMGKWKFTPTTCRDSRAAPGCKD